METSELRDRLTNLMPQVRRDLEDLVRIQSVSADPARASEVQRSADATAALLAAEGFEDVRVVTANNDGFAPAVLARKPAQPGQPTVLLYAHHDVQPENDPADWDSPPWEPTERNGRLYGRGAADDKAGIMAHIAAIRTLGDDLKVGVTMFIEGEEEVASATLPDLLAQHQDYLTCDTIVIADSGNWDIGVPALTTTLRGSIRCDLEVRTMTHAVHSGMWGGLVPDALMTLSRVISSMYDAEGGVAVAGLHSGPAADVDYPEERLRAESGALPQVDWIGSGSAVARMWTQPSITVTGIDAPKVDGASNTLTPVARAKVTIRTAPGDSSANAFECLERHMEANMPFGAAYSLTLCDYGEPTEIDATGPAYDAARAAFTEAWDGTEPIDMGVGGSIPFIAEFLERFPDASVLVTGVEDPDTRAHGANEGLHLAEFERVCLAEALLLDKLAN